MEGQNVAVERYEFNNLAVRVLNLEADISEIKENLSIFMAGCESMQRTQENILATLEMIINKVKNRV